MDGIYFFFGNFNNKIFFLGIYVEYEGGDIGEKICFFIVCRENKN